ncbi:MAG: hypothetical protein ACRDJ5_05265, partial [Actinomycetota bacterium]
MTSEDDLFGLPLEEFTRARNDLAAELRRGGDREGAARVKALRKPSITAWALNQVARSHPEDAERVVVAGERLLEAQRGTPGGDGREGMRRATSERREAVAALARRAAAALEEAGAAAGRTHVDRIT